MIGHANGEGVVNFCSKFTGSEQREDLVLLKTSRVLKNKCVSLLVLDLKAKVMELCISPRNDDLRSCDETFPGQQFQKHVNIHIPQYLLILQS